MKEKELFDSFWLASIEGIGAKSVEKLVNEAGSVAGVCALTDDRVAACIGKKRAEALKAANTEKGHALSGRRLLRILEKKITFLPRWHPDYPNRLKQIPDPPLMLFLKGRLPDEKQKLAAVIGARACSAYGAQMARFFANQLAVNGVGIGSGMARCIDCIAQEAALLTGQNSVAVLGCGVDICYPPENQRLYEQLEMEGCLLSEYMPGTRPQAHLFPPRNRIISGMSDLVLVVEAREQSGTLITVDMALEQGREVFAVPGRVMDLCSRGCNRLIAHGAGIATDPEVLLEALGGENFGGLDIRQGGRMGENIHGSDRLLTKEVLTALDSDSLSLDELAARTGFSDRMAELMQELVLLNMEGIVICQGGRYGKKI